MQAKSVRGPRGVQMEEVWAAADAVLALGERPTIERVRLQLGRGSPNTVGPMIDGWFGSLAGRLQAPVDPADSANGPTDAETPLPGPVIRAAKTLWGRALQQADERAAEQFAQARTALEAEAESLRHAQEALAREQQRLDDRNEAYAVAMQARDAQIAELARQAQELQQQLQTSQQLLEATRSEGAQLRQEADAQRRRHEAKEAEHQAERSRLEERAQAQERRLNAEVDRARQESKRLALQLEADGKKAAKALADAMDRARELDTHVGALQIDKAGLSQELQSARDEVKGLQAKFDERSNDVFALLNELRDRLPTGAAVGTAPPPTRARRKRS
ncbi:DNA-binding protein [Acidovorax sp. Root219]|uniref:DNA-binding protein n=1 Tax=Acidovorax sp. Root219 TaxID=1736493 RepID=UPI00070A5D5C|nr:DNA-binding protein [Acidovorax sp. Root219]KRC26380.1 DNA-binding protein [Acidovorax sp. Root219]